MIKSLHATGRIILLKLEEGESIHQSIARALQEQDIRLAWIQGLGGLKWARIGYFDPANGVYKPVDIEATGDTVLELASLTGNAIKGPNNEYHIHIHAVIGVDDGRTIAGHLVDSTVEPLAEIALIELSGDYMVSYRLFRHRWTKY